MKRSVAITVSVLIVSLVFASCAKQGPTKVSNWQSVKNADVNTYITSPKSDAHPANINVVTFTGATSLQSFSEQALISLEEGLPDFQLSKDDVEFAISYFTVIEREFTVSLDEDISIVQYYVQLEHKISIFTYVGTPIQLSRDKSAFTEWIESQALPKSISALDLLVPSAFAQLSKKETVENMHKEINKALEGAHIGINRWLRSIWEDPPKRVIKRVDLTKFTDKDLVLYAGKEVVNPEEYLEYIFDYPESFGDVFIEWKVTGNGEYISAFKVKNSYWVRVRAGKPGEFVISASVHVNSVDDTSLKTTSWTIPKAWVIDVRSLEEPTCPDGQSLYNDCATNCSSDGKCVKASTRNDGQLCYKCERPVCSNNTQTESDCKNTCDGSCEYSHLRPIDKVACYRCKAEEDKPEKCIGPAKPYDDCAAECDVVTESCTFVHATKDDTSCYTCEKTCTDPAVVLPTCAASCDGICETVSKGKDGTSCYQCNDALAPCPKDTFIGIGACADSCSSVSQCKKVDANAGSFKSCYVCNDAQKDCSDGLLNYKDCQDSCKNQCKFESLSTTNRQVQCFRCQKEEIQCPDGMGADKSYCNDCDSGCIESRIEGKICYMCEKHNNECPTGTYPEKCPDNKCPHGCTQVSGSDKVCYKCNPTPNEGGGMIQIDPPQICITPDGKSHDCTGQ